MRILTVVDQTTATAGLGATFRKRTNGREGALIDEFLSHPPFNAPRGCQATAFIEPKLDSGFPDIVLVYWTRACTTSWPKARAKLTPDDLRVAHFLFTQGPSESPLLALTFSRVDQSLERLEAANMVRRTGERWLLRPLSRVFAVKNIVAIEAKVSEWEAALRQAILNTWFASDAFVLIPRLPRGEVVLRAASSHGIGVCTVAEDNTRPALTRSPALPRSYASWLFNEWVWRVDGRAKGERHS